MTGTALYLNSPSVWLNTTTATYTNSCAYTTNLYTAQSPLRWYNYPSEDATNAWIPNVSADPRGGNDWRIAAVAAVRDSAPTPQELIAREQARVTAISRAKELLLSCLTTEQRTMLEQQGKFRVVSNYGHVFEIVQGRQHNIFRLDAMGVRIEEWCVHVAPPDIPNYDNMLAQKLCIETDERDLYRQANVWTLPNHGLVHSAGREVIDYPRSVVVAPASALGALAPVAARVHNPYGVAA